MAKKSKTQIYLEYYTTRAVVGVLQSLPIQAALLLGRAIGTLAYHIDRRHRAVALENLAIAYGDQMDQEQMRQITKRVFQHFITVGAEMVQLYRLINAKTWRKYITIRNEAYLHETLFKHKSIIFVTGHLGNWEVLGCVMSLLGFPCHSVAKSLGNPLLDDYIVRFREQLGQKIIIRQGALSKLADHLEQGGYAGFLADQNERKRGVFVDFFGRKASTVRSIAALALTLELPIVLGFAFRCGKGFQFEFMVDELIMPADWTTADRQKDIENLTAYYTKRIEHYVRMHPEQWLWLHRRWKTRPPEESDK